MFPQIFHNFSTVDMETTFAKAVKRRVKRRTFGRKSGKKAKKMEPAVGFEPTTDGLQNGSP